MEKATPDTTLETVVESTAEQFLSAKSLSCLSLVTSDKESPSFVRRHIDSGEVFTVRGYIRRKVNRESKYGMFTKKFKTMDTLNQPLNFLCALTRKMIMF